ncbi:glutathione-dependent formaldehyde dehydrogenase [Pseudomonas psychrotolerans]|uniref:zinc-dependent alcohol dehydrogenase n=1 Tax=Pseudomonas oryzihabitans TaxID=47885 RepID=UPI0015E29D58|nr:zinc-dependent alcohol dehydrogenase [Pseudomonas psychrotolerans]MBA1180676.1 glutathione-dependent formaldehyde dehydrogenase [Pseudomonas psychrotolerans]
MRALTYHGAHDVRVDTVPDPTIQDADDIVLRVTATAICGSDLHLYRGKIPTVEHGDIFGHEFMGIVEETGPAVTAVQKGDRVVIPFVIACGSCFFCNQDLYAACETTNTGRGAILNKKQIPPGAALFGFSHLYGGVPGGQAEYVRVPKANTGPFKVPGTLADEKVLFLSDILPTAWQAVLNTGIGQGSSIAIYGAGPVGLLSAACARMLGAERIFMVDHHSYRLAYAQQTYGVIPINFDEDDDPAATIIEQTPGKRGVDGVVDAVGFEAKGSTTETILANLKLEGSSGKALRQCIAAVRRGGTVSVPGVYAGFIHGFLFGDAFDKGLTFKMGQTHVQRYLPELLEHIERGDLAPEAIITHRMSLEQAVEGYKIFDKKQEDCRKVILTPGRPEPIIPERLEEPLAAPLGQAGVV